MESLERVVSNPEQLAAERWEQASTIMVKYADQLERRTSRDGEDTYLVTPAFVPKEATRLPGGFGEKWNRLGNIVANGKTKESERVYAQKYSLAALVDKRQKRYQPGDPLYLIINDNLTNPQVRINAFGGGLQLLDESFNEIEDKGRYVPNILEIIDNRLKANHLYARHKSKAKIIGVSIVGSILAVASTGGLLYWHKREADAAADNRARAAFDAKNINLSSEPAIADDILFMPSDPQFFTPDLPAPADNDNFRHPRKVTMGNEGCKHLTDIDVKSEAVLTATDGPGEKIMVAVNSAGDVEACYFGEVVKDKFPQVVLQVVNKPAR